MQRTGERRPPQSPGRLAILVEQFPDDGLLVVRQDTGNPRSEILYTFMEISSVTNYNPQRV
jgi:hypothetical protein